MFVVIAGGKGVNANIASARPVISGNKCYRIDRDAPKRRSRDRTRRVSREAAGYGPEWPVVDLDDVTAADLDRTDERATEQNLSGL